MSHEEYFGNSAFEKYEVIADRDGVQKNIGFQMLPPDPCNFRRKNSDAKHLITTFVTQTRLEILQRKLFRERQKEMEEMYSTEETALVDNFYLHIMGI